jgi:type IV secretion system protein TrbL
MSLVRRRLLFRAGLLSTLPFGALAALAPFDVHADSPGSCADASNPITGTGCTLGQIGQTVANAPADVAGFAADQAERALTKWVVDAADWLLNHLGDAVFDKTSPVLTADWFHTHYAEMVAVAWVVAPLFLLLGVIQATMRADLGVLGRIAAQLVVVAIFTTGAVAIAQMLVGSVDQLSGFISDSAQGDIHTFLSITLRGTMAAALSLAQGGTPGADTPPLAFVFLSAILIVLGAALIWLELLARTLVIYAALLFFPILLATAIWPRLNHVVRRFVEVLAAVIVSKFIIVVILAAGVGTIEAMGKAGQGPALLIGAGLVLLAAWAPWKFYRLLPLMEAGILHHAAAPFQSGWHRVRTQGWRQTRNAANRTYRTGNPLPIAGQHRQNPRPGPPRPNRPPVPGGPGGGARPGGGAPGAPTPPPPRRPSGPVAGRPGPGAPAGWRTVRVAGGGSIHVPGERVRNPRPPGA